MLSAMNPAGNNRLFSPMLVLVFGALCISFAPIFVKWVGEARLGPTAIGFWRTLFGGLTLVLVTLVRGRTLRLSARLIGFSALAGFVFFVDLWVWHRSIVYCGAGMSTILGNMQVFATAIISHFLFREKLGLRFMSAAVTAILGVVLLVGILSEDVAFTTRYLQGVIFGLLTAVAYAHYLTALKWTGHKSPIPDVVAFMAWTSLFSALFLGTSAAIEPGPILPPDPSSWLLLISLGIVAQALGWWSITTSLAKIPVARAGLVLLLQPTLATLWGALFFGERLMPLQIVGAALTLIAIYYGSLKER
jgi:drug/metabolite transporter (DMT)-like permease